VTILWKTRRGSALLALAGLAAAAAVTLIGAGPATAAVPANMGEVGWGRNNSGQLGDGTTQDTSVPVRAAGLTGGIRQIAGGTAHTLAVGSNGEVWAWGNNDSGQLGDGTRENDPVPTRVPGIDNAVAVAAGHLFSLAVLADGTVKAWGDNSNGQLGIPGPDVLSPVTVPGVSSVVTVAAGRGHSLALRGDGTVWGWGDNDFGQLGDGTIDSRPAPAPVHNLTGVRQLVSGSLFAMALRADGTVHAWGLGDQGELGNGLTPRRQLLPVAADIDQVVHISAGMQHSLAVRADGSVWAWGSNVERQVTDSAEITQPRPVRMPGLPSIVQVAGAAASSVALASTGAVLAWGSVAGDPNVDTGVPFTVAGLTDVTAIAAGGTHYLAVVKPPFTIRLSPATGTVAAGGDTTTQVSLTPATRYTRTPPHTVSGLPPGVTVDLTSAVVGVRSPSTITFHNPAGSPAGRFPITITATDNAAAVTVQTATYQLTVAPAGNFTIALSPTSGTIAPGASTTTTVHLTPLNGFSGTAALSTTGLPAGVTATFTPGTVSTRSPATLTLVAAPNCRPGTYNVTVVASASGGEWTATYQLTVAGPPS
jgi:alpha-tubulin suppressor-like RCC1 family protein